MIKLIENKLGNDYLSISALKALFFISGLIVATFAGRIPFFKEILIINEVELGMLLIFPSIGALLGLAMAGWLSKRFKSNIISVYAVVICGFALLLIGLSTHYVAIAFGFVILGIAGNCLNVSMNTLAIWLEKELSHSLMSSFHGYFSIGGLIGSAICAGAVFFSVPIFYHFIGIIILTSAIVLFFAKRLPKVQLEKKRKSKAKIVIKKSIGILGAMACLILVTEGAIADWSGVFLKQKYFDLPYYSTLGYTFFLLSMIIGRLIGDRITETLSRIGLVQLSLILTLVGVGLVTFSYVIWLALLGFGIMGFGLSCTIPIIYHFAGRDKTIHTATALSTVATFGFVGIFAGPPLIGFIAGLSDLGTAIFSVISSALFLAFGFTMLFVKETSRNVEVL